MSANQTFEKHRHFAGLQYVTSDSLLAGCSVSFNFNHPWTLKLVFFDRADHDILMDFWGTLLAWVNLKLELLHTSCDWEKTACSTGCLLQRLHTKQHITQTYYFYKHFLFYHISLWSRLAKCLVGITLQTTTCIVVRNQCADVTSFHLCCFPKALHLCSFLFWQILYRWHNSEKCLFICYS